MSSDEEIRRGNHARQLLDDELLKEAFEKIKSDLMSAWLQSPARDSEARETIYLSVKILGKIESHLQMIADTGKLASFNPKEN